MSNDLTNQKHQSLANPVRGAWKDMLTKSSTQQLRRRYRPQNNVIALLIDTSASMEGMALAEAMQGARELIQSLPGSAAVSLVSFNSMATILTRATTDRDALFSAIHSLSANGSTNMTAALELGYEVLREFHSMAILYLVTDGYPNDAPSALKVASCLKELDVRIITLGTEDADHSFLAQLASSQDEARIGTTKTLAADIAALRYLLPSSE